MKIVERFLNLSLLEHCAKLASAMSKNTVCPLKTTDLGRVNPIVDQNCWAERNSSQLRRCRRFPQVFISVQCGKLGSSFAVFRGRRAFSISIPPSGLFHLNNTSWESKENPEARWRRKTSIMSPSRRFPSSLLKVIKSWYLCTLERRQSNPLRLSRKLH